MDIKYIGHSSFLIKSKDAKVVIDPFDKSIGIHFPKTEADVVTISHHHIDHDSLSNIPGEPLVIDWPGEFECKGVRITGYASYHDAKKGEERGENVIYKFEVEGITVLHMGDIGHIVDDKLVEEIGPIDVLMIPVGGRYTIDATQASDVIKKLEPTIVIPMHYNHKDLDQKQFADVNELDVFLKKMGVVGTEPVARLTLRPEDLTDEMKVVVMSYGA
ncbi:MAG: MBL fold metallo-hydrolase [Candidatus Roizmanbacteria bacterium]